MYNQHQYNQPRYGMAAVIVAVVGIAQAIAARQTELLKKLLWPPGASEAKRP